MMTQIQNPTGKVMYHEPMSNHTSWRVGGLADRLYIPGGIDDLALFLKSLSHGEPIHFVGLGSNLLVRDGGVRGTVILLHGGSLDRLTITQNTVYAEAGVTCAKLAKFSAKQHLHGAEFFSGIPGTVGGALAMNAGCHGSETWDVVHHALTIDRGGVVNERSQVDLEIGYRHVGLPSEEWFVAAWFELQPGNAATAEQKNQKPAGKKAGIATIEHAQCRLDFQESGRRFRRASDSILRIERTSSGWGAGLGKTCQFHRQYR